MKSLQKSPKKKSKKKLKALKFNEVELTYDISLEKTKTVRAYFGGVEELFEGIPAIKLIGKSKKECDMIPMMHIRKMRVPLIKIRNQENHYGGMYV